MDSVLDRMAALDYCESEVRKNDFGSYLHGLMLPPEIRPFHYAAHALRLELTRSREAVNNPSLLTTKLTWWLENLEAIWANNPADEPISVAINELRKHHVVRKSHFERLVRGNFEEIPLKNWRLFDRFIDNNYTMIYYISLELFHCFQEKEFQAATYAGRAWGISQHLLRTKYYSDQGRFYIPEELLEKYGVPLSIAKENEETHENELPEGFFDLILEIAAYGKQNLEKAREFNDLPKHAYLSFLQMSQAEYFYKKLEKGNFDIFQAKTRKTFWPSVTFKMIKCARKGRF